MIAVDTNILVYSHRRDSEWHVPALAFIKGLAEDINPWSIPWPCVHEFISIVTHPRIYAPPSTLQQAVAQVEAWTGSPSLVLIGESENHWEVLCDLLVHGKVRGPTVHDARVAAICLSHGVKEFCSADRDFSHFPKLSIRNPLLGQ